MTVGTQATVTTINQNLTLYSTQLRDICQQILNFQEYLNGAAGIGTAGLETIGFSAADAAVVLTMSNYLNTIAQIYYGTATQATDFNFSSATSPLWAGQ